MSSPPFQTLLNDLHVDNGSAKIIQTSQDSVYLKANTEKGEALLAALPMLEDAADDAADAAKDATRKVLEKLPLKNLSTDKFGGDKLMELFGSDKWAGLSEACLGCGTCTFVCPTSELLALPHPKNGGTSLPLRWTASAEAHGWRAIAACRR